MKLLPVLILVLLHCGLVPCAAQTPFVHDSINAYQKKLANSQSAKAEVTPIQIAKMQMRLGDFYIEVDSFSRAEGEFLSALDVVNSMADRDLSLSLWLQLRIASANRFLGKTRFAEKVLRGVLQEIDDNRIQSKLLLAFTHEELARISLLNEDTVAARTHYYQAAEQLLKAPDAPVWQLLRISSKMSELANSSDEEYVYQVMLRLTYFLDRFARHDSSAINQAQVLLAKAEVRNGLYPDAISRYARILANSREVTRTDSIVRLECYSGLSLSYRKQGILDSAAAEAQRAIDLALELYGPISTACCNAWKSFAEIQSEMRNAKETLRGYLVVRYIRTRLPVRNWNEFIEETARLSEAFRKMGLYARADSIITSHLQAYPIPPGRDSIYCTSRLLYELAECKYRQRFNLEADTILQRIRTHSPDRYDRDGEYCKVLLLSGYVAEQLDTTDRGFRHYHELLRYTSGNESHYASIRVAAIQRILAYSADENNEDVIDYLKEVLYMGHRNNLQPSDFAYYSARLANVYLAAGEFNRAASIMDTLRIDPDSLSLYSPSTRIALMAARRMVAFVRQDYCTAATMIAEEREANKTMGTESKIFSYAFQGYYYALCGDSVKAKNALALGDTIERLNESDIKAPNQARLDRAYGEYFRLRKNFDSASARFSRAIALFERHSKTQDYELGGSLAGYGRVLFELGRYNEAIDVFQRARDLGTSFARGVAAFLPYMFPYAKSLWLSGDLVRAEDEYIAAIRATIDLYGDYHPSLAHHLEDLLVITRKLGHTSTTKDVAAYLKELKRRSKRESR